MKKYVVTFLFTEDLQNVWLIEKQKPEWQKGCLNGIGGKIELNEIPLNAAIRELREESGIREMPILVYLGCMEGINNDSSSFSVAIYTSITSQELKTQEAEQIKLIPVSELKSHKLIENVPSLIELCLYKLTGKSNFKDVVMNY